MKARARINGEQDKTIEEGKSGKKKYLQKDKELEIELQIGHGLQSTNQHYDLQS